MSRPEDDQQLCLYDTASSEIYYILSIVSIALTRVVLKISFDSSTIKMYASETALKFVSMHCFRPSYDECVIWKVN